MNTPVITEKILQQIGIDKNVFNFLKRNNLLPLPIDIIDNITLDENANITLDDYLFDSNTIDDLVFEFIKEKLSKIKVLEVNDNGDITKYMSSDGSWKIIEYDKSGKKIISESNTHNIWGTVTYIRKTYNHKFNTSHSEIKIQSNDKLIIGTEKAKKLKNGIIITYSDYENARYIDSTDGYSLNNDDDVDIIFDKITDDNYKDLLTNNNINIPFNLIRALSIVTNENIELLKECNEYKTIEYNEPGFLSLEFLHNDDKLVAHYIDDLLQQVEIFDKGRSVATTVFTLFYDKNKNIIENNKFETMLNKEHTISEKYISKISEHGQLLKYNKLNIPEYNER